VLRIARWSMSHRRVVVGLWVVVLAGSIAAAGGLGNRFVNNLTLPNTDAQRAADLLSSRFPTQAGDVDQIVFRARTGKVTDASVRPDVLRAVAAVARLPHVTSVVGPYASSRAVSQDGTIGFATVTFDKRSDALASADVERVIASAELARSSRLEVELGGAAIQETQRPTLGAATAIGIGAAMVILLISFGSFLAMGLPILTALFGLGSSMGLIAILTHLLNTPDFASELALLIGLGVGIDYALFLVTRYRDAYRANGGDVRAAIELAMNTAGRSIAFAGITVVIAVMGLFVVGVPLFYGVALATSLSVLLVLSASLTLLPALLMFAGRRVGERSSKRRTKHAKKARLDRGLWLRWIGVIQRRPAIAATAATLLLLLLAAPSLGLRLASSDAGNDPASSTSRKAYDLLSKGFGSGFNGPLVLVARLPSTGDTSGLKKLAAAVAATPGVASVGKPELNPTRDTAVVSVFPASSPQSKQTSNLVATLRATVIPTAEQARKTTVYIGGFTAAQVDFARVLSGKLPLFIGAVILLSALLLLLLFRSFLIPLQAAAMNLLSIGAALGVVQAIFERGWLAGLIGVSRSPIEAFIPVIVFAIVFGLSMDYEVFLVSRVHEEWRARGDHSAAIREGLLRTGRVITAAAAVMMVVFGSFAAGNNHILKLFGISLASAIFLDAIVIRSILLPAVLQLLGRATWALPRWADRILPHIPIDAPPGSVIGPQPTTLGATPEPDTRKAA
jgi:RND superfamily putative drug exporter